MSANSFECLRQHFLDVGGDQAELSFVDYGQVGSKAVTKDTQAAGGKRLVPLGHQCSEHAGEYVA
jgi:hypothetical protein